MTYAFADFSVGACPVQSPVSEGASNQISTILARPLFNVRGGGRSGWISLFEMLALRGKFCRSQGGEREGGRKSASEVANKNFFYGNFMPKQMHYFLWSSADCCRLFQTIRRLCVRLMGLRICAKPYFPASLFQRL